MVAVLIRRLFFIVLLIVPGFAFSQLQNQKTIDSLLVLVTKTPVSTKKIELLNRLSIIHFTINPDRGINFANEALKLSEDIKWNNGIAHAYNCLASNYWAKYDYGNAMYYYGLALKISETINDDRLISSCLHNIGTCYEAQKLYQDAIPYYKKSITIYTRLGDMKRKYGCLANIAEVYLKSLKYNDALEFYKQALQVSQKIKDERHVDFFCEKIAMVYLAMGNLPKARQYENIATVSLKKLNDHEDTMRNMADLGEIALKAREYPQAIFQFECALKVLKEYTGKDAGAFEATFYANIGKSYLAMATDSSKANSHHKEKYLHLAIENLTKSVNIARSVDFKEGLIEYLKVLSNAWVIRGNFHRALDNYKASIASRDSLFGSEKEKEYTRRGLQFEFARKRDSLSYVSKLQKIQQQNAIIQNAGKLKQRSLFGGLIIIALLFIVFYVGFTKRIQRINFNTQLAKEKSEIKLNQVLFERKLNDLTLASLKAQMNPHFIFNCLNSIKFYVEINETDAASIYITRFSKLIRHTLDSARQERVTLSKEIELITLYLEMEKMRLKEKLRYEFNIAADIDADFIEIPSLLIQPYIENSIWHGIMPKANGGLVKLSIEKSTDRRYLMIKIEDNGIGRKKPTTFNGVLNNHVSHGGNLNNERIAMLNTKYRAKTEVMLTDLHDADYNACGTLITLKLFFNEIFENSNY